MNAITTADLTADKNHAASKAENGVELLYTPAESLFAAAAPDMAANGWSVFPQDQDRRPGTVYGAMIKWGAEGLNLANTRAGGDVFEKWCLHCGSLNVAAVFGPASGHTFAIDIDVIDEAMAAEIATLAGDLLGYTPLRREGRFPKIALIYRHAPDDVVASRSRWLAGDDGAAGEHGIEILGAGKLLTFHGRHHKTGTYFKWLDQNPQVVGPEAAPLVTAEAVSGFMSAVESLYGFAEHGRSTARLSRGAGATWPPEGAISGEKASDGREQALFRIINTSVTSFDPAFWEAVDAGDAALVSYRDAKLAEVCDRFAAENDLTDRWAPHRLAGKALGRLDHWIGKLKNGKRPLANKMRRADGGKAAEEGKNGKPSIRVEAGEITAAVDEAERILRESGRGIYQRAGRLVFVGSVPVETRDGKPVTATKILERTEPALLEDLSAVANWERFDGRSKGYIRIDPPQKVVATLAARVGRWSLSVLDGVITAPTIRYDGRILATPGYDAQTGLLFDPQGVGFPAIAENPTREDAEAALRKLKGLLQTFPFVDPQDEAAALSGMLTALVRRSLDKAPMHAYTAPTPGSGKSMLVDLCCILATGREAPVLAQGGGEEELEKRLSAALLDGDSIISIDNVEAPLGGAFLNQATTQPYVKPRILGQSKVPEILCNASFYATGNNLVLYADMVRRALLISLDPRVERPELRQFKNDPVADAKRMRGELVQAALTIIRAHEAAGRPGSQAPVGSYGAWCRFVRDPLTWLGEADPWLTTERARELDPKLEAMQTIIAQWCTVLADGRFTVAEVIKRATEMMPVEGTAFGREFRNPEFREALLSVAGEGGSINSRRLGKWLLAHAGRIVGDMEIRKGAERGGVATWSIVIHGTSTRQSEFAAGAEAVHAKRVADWGRVEKVA